MDVGRAIGEGQRRNPRQEWAEEGLVRYPETPVKLDRAADDVLKHRRHCHLAHRDVLPRLAVRFAPGLDFIDQPRGLEHEHTELFELDFGIRDQPLHELVIAQLASARAPRNRAFEHHVDRPPTPPDGAQADARHMELLDTALTMFLEHGYEQTTVEGIAAATGMTKRTLYTRYPKKSALFRAAVSRAIDRSVTAGTTLDALDESDLEAALNAVARARVTHAVTPEGLRLQRIINAES